MLPWHVGGMDFIVVSEVLLFTDEGATMLCINIIVVNDDIFEETENFFLALNSSDDRVILSPSVATIFILDDDGIFVLGQC